MPGPDVDDPYPRDLRGHGRRRPHPRWPGDARVAVSFVLNVEEGGENSILHGDAGMETVRRLMKVFDPKGILNPGNLLPEAPSPSVPDAHAKEVPA